ncbi:MAG: AAA family ATPase, partial [bacterium]|nr:AAA family ATPase [bacterium]
MERNHPVILKQILDDISQKIPGIGTIKTYRDEITNNLYLLFRDKGFAKPFTQQQMSDGTLKMFCYMLLLQNPEPPPFICIEEPENGLYHKLLETLAAEFRAHASGRKGGSQVFITTHQPYFVDALDPGEVWVLEKGENGFATIKRASDYPYVKSMTEEGQPLGGLWASDYVDAR